MYCQHARHLSDLCSRKMDSSIIGFAAATLTTAAYVPQVWHTWSTKSTKDLSLPMLLMFVTGILCWLVYGILLGDAPMTTANAITFVLSSSLLVMKVRDRGK